MPKKIIAWSEPTVFNQDITDLIENHYGCLPVKLSQNKPDDLIFVLEMVRKSGGGVILAGGNDISTVTLNLQAERGDNLSKWDILRDRRELFAIDYCFENDIPILGICRGFQLILGVKYGLGIMQDISGFPIAHSPSVADIKINEEKGEYLHWVTVFPEFHQEFYEREWATSFHHQGVIFEPRAFQAHKYLGIGVEVLGIADLNVNVKKENKQDIIELARGLDHRWLAFQGHCEAGADYLRNNGSRKIVDKFAELIKL